MIHEVVLRWEQGSRADEGRPRRYVDVVVTLMERAAYSLSSQHIVIERDGKVVREWQDGKPVGQPLRDADGEVVDL